MEHLKSALRPIRWRIGLLTFVWQLLIGALSAWLYSQHVLKPVDAIAIFTGLSLVGSLLIGWRAAELASVPLKAIGQAILHIAPGQTDTAAPNFDQLVIGRQYVTSLAYQLYQIASLQDNKDLAEHRRDATQASNILTHLPLPLLVFNKEQIVTFASDSMLSYVNVQSAELFGKQLFEGLDLEFPSQFTLESWIADCQTNKATDTAYWRRVRVHLKDESGTMRQCDIAGYYNRDNPSGIEFIITLFDRSQEYAQDDQALSFIALAVHELRTPLTMMRGLIEVFEEELAGKLDPELTKFMQRLHTSAQQLSAFVNNILNVARVEENQLAVRLTEENLADLIHHARDDMNVRAETMGKTISYQLAKGLPTVAADRVTVYEVLCNLLDNAIKYSGKSKEITVSAQTTKDGLVEVDVIDKGVGIPSSVLPTLFEKYHRNHRNRSQISGTGLGLYLSKAIVNAHGGDIWVSSKEGEGTTVAFTLKPYALLADELKSGNNKDDMVRTAHGWIKNHSLYRR